MDVIAQRQWVRVDGRRIELSNLDKVLYPDAGFTKGGVIGYYDAVAPVLLPHLARRPVTLIRYPEGVDDESFFAKNVPSHAPDWIRTARLPAPHSSSGRDAIDYLLVDDRATLVWLANLAGLELHVPQWTVSSDGVACEPDLLVIDLDPGPPAGLAECMWVATVLRARLADDGLTAYPKTSGRKGMQLLCPVSGQQPDNVVSGYAHRLADELADRHPERIVRTMTKRLRRGKVFLDWSQNNAAKTTVAPYSLRARPHPTVSTPLTWAEVEAGEPLVFGPADVLARVAADGDLLAGLATRGPRLPTGRPTARRPHRRDGRRRDDRRDEPRHDERQHDDRHRDERHDPPRRAAQPGDEPDDDRRQRTDRLTHYRSRRDPRRTPEPVPDAGPLPAGDDDTFVIQQHHARRLHWDLRLERGGVLVSWAVPRGVPAMPGTNRLAVHTEDHPLEYAAFSGTIPAGEYGGGEVSIFDRGTYHTRDWTDRKVTVELHGTHVRGTYVLFHTRDKDWMIRRLDPPSDPDRRPVPDGVAPMLAVRQRTLPRPADRYWYEFDWGGRRALGVADGGRLRLRDADGADVGDRYRPVAGVAAQLGAREALLDGELVTVRGTPLYVLYDLLHLDGRDLCDRPQWRRRQLLDELSLGGEHWQLSPRFDDARAVRATARERDLPGIVARRRDAPYRPGTTSTAWKRVPAR